MSGPSGVAESAVAGWMRRHGFPDAAAMDHMVDTGVHVIASRAVAQVRISPALVGVEDLRRLVHDSQMMPGCYRIAFSVAGFSGEAMRFAEECSIALLVLRPDGSAVPVNAWGENLAGSRPNSTSLAPDPASLTPIAASTVPAKRSHDVVRHCDLDAGDRCHRGLGDVHQGQRCRCFHRCVGRLPAPGVRVLLLRSEVSATEALVVSSTKRAPHSR